MRKTQYPYVGIRCPDTGRFVVVEEKDLVDERGRLRDTAALIAFAEGRGA